MGRAQPIVNVSDLFSDPWREVVAYGNVTQHTPLMTPATPLAAAVLYLMLQRPLRALCRGYGADGKSGMFQCSVLVHNFVLCAYSLASFVGSSFAVAERVRTQGVLGVFCDPDGTLWEGGVGFWTYCFYISKLYEFFDTCILIVKGKPVSVLQSFHHAGAVVVMWLITASRTPCGMIFVWLNSLVHTFMYAYFGCAAAGIRLPGKWLLTAGQILQFVTGQAVGLPIKLGWVDAAACRITPAQHLAIDATYAYVSVLIVLFGRFFWRSYVAKGRGKRGGGRGCAAESPAAGEGAAAAEGLRIGGEAAAARDKAE